MITAKARHLHNIGNFTEERVLLVSAQHTYFKGLPEEDEGEDVLEEAERAVAPGGVAGLKALIGYGVRGEEWEEAESKRTGATLLLWAGIMAATYLMRSFTTPPSSPVCQCFRRICRQCRHCWQIQSISPRSTLRAN